MKRINSEIEGQADFSIIRYAQSWEDADVALEAMAVQAGDRCLTIGSGGDNVFSLLTCNPSQVIAVDLSPAQIACIELKMAAYRQLSHGQLLELVGAVPSTQRPGLYQSLRTELPRWVRDYWDGRPGAIAEGIGSAGKFECYFKLFRRYVLPLIHSKKTLKALFEPRSIDAQRAFYQQRWDNWRWRILFKLFFSKQLMGRLGRDPSFFQFVQGDVSRRILQQAQHAMSELSPAQNPYLQWIAFGRYVSALPHALRAEHFSTIRDNLECLQIRQAPIERVLSELDDRSVDRFNMSDIFEYLSVAASDEVFRQIARTGRQGGRLIYWNMLAERHHPPALDARFRLRDELSQRLHREAKACFYSAFYVEELL